MKKFDLSGIWELEGGKYATSGKIPGSVYSILLKNGLMDDPFYRDNELKAIEIMDNEFTFSRKFNYEKPSCPVLLHADGLDTLCDIYINGKHIAFTDNMHRTYEFPISDAIITGENEIKIVIHPYDEYIKAKNAEHPLPGCKDCTSGFPYIRKAHCMMGWDWGARLPDGGIWRDIYLLEKDSARISDFKITQRHSNGKVFITPQISLDTPAEVTLRLTSPSGESITIPQNEETEIENPQLWWPNGLGEQPLYTLLAEVTEGGRVVDSKIKRIGLRTLKLIREKDRWGEGFCHEVNGIKFFAMGADYIPEDNILSRITESRTRELLSHCQASNFNAIRVWGGGYFPDDFFFDACDELGIVVFLDLMFACCLVDLSDEGLQNVKAEIIDNIKRLRHHACLAVISGNNEIEQEGALWWDKTAMADYMKSFIDFFEGEVPDILSELCPDIPYIPSSPTSFGHFVDPTNEDYGDSHYWDVWHGNKPFTEYRNHYFRYLSEFGFQSFPSQKTVNSFTLPSDRNIFSRIMEMHQRNDSANGKILSYLSETFRYPAEFGTLLYATQLLQAESIKYGVEHLRRHRGRCMGTLYWQLNDIWPVASWASIDYYGRFKALQYYAKRFYAPVLLSVKEIGERDTRPCVNMERTADFSTKAQFCITNDTLREIPCQIKWELKSADSKNIAQGELNLSVPPMEAKWAEEELDFNKTDVDNNYLSYHLYIGGKEISSGAVIFTAPKYFNYLDPKLSCEINGDEITVTSHAFAKSVEIDSPDSDFILEDNYFDMDAGTKTVKILKGTPKTIRLRSVYDIK